MVSNVMLTLCFLAAVLVVYYMLPGKYRFLCLLAASIWFYMSVNPAMILLIGTSTLWIFGVGLKLEQENQKNRRGWLLGGSLPLVVVLLIFKYANFFVDSMAEWIGRLGFGGDVRTLQLVMPLGISYYTFKLLSYLFDVYRGKMKAERNVGYFSLYALFFPQILSGPIERAEILLPQFRAPQFDRVLFVRGLERIVLGLFKKMVIANRLSVYVDTVFGDPSAYPALAAWMAAVFYAIQLYCDFSGYSDLAIGMSDLMGIRCRENFRMPYFSTGIKEFWSRWHISLSSWLRDYVYIPLGGSRVSAFRRRLNVLITFLVSGLWHGNSISFVVWGAIHGVWNMLGKKEQPKNRWQRIWKTCVTFAGVNLAWIFFRAENLGAALLYLKRMVSGISFSYDAILSSVLPFSGDNTCAALLLTVLGMILLLFVYEWRMVFGKPSKQTEGEREILSVPFLVLFVLLVALFGVFGNSGFLYANF